MDKFLDKYTPEIKQVWMDYLHSFNNKEFNTHSISDTSNEQLQHSTGKCCVIVEPRIGILLPLVIRNFVHLLAPKGWRCVVFHGNLNEKYIKDIFQTPPELQDLDTNNFHQYNQYITFINLGVDNLTRDKYSDLLVSQEFWNILKYDIHCKNALIFQTDTILLNPDIIDEFMQYDFVGAIYILDDNSIGFNGGLSLRKVDTMLHLIAEYGHFITQSIDEDLFFFKSLRTLQPAEINIPQYYVCQRFSIESININPYNNSKNDVPFGLHQTSPHILLNHYKNWFALI